MTGVDPVGPGRVPPTSQELPVWLKQALRLPNTLYGRGWGRLLGHRFLQLTHVGRRSGRTFHTVLEVVRYAPGTGEATVLSGFGPQADWLRNLKAAGSAEVSFGAGPRRAAYRILPVEEAEQVIADYERRNRLLAPVVRPVLSQLVGWDYDGSTPARRRLVDQLPMVAFRPGFVDTGDGVAGNV
ncbi:MAG: nitroreductase family deazaflavin-dependent oxidoreductase [Intrasporangium sp.]|uniref:nitroreductase family deazaflavin-dependent oxidoreductase n=1 Tax=Intrasporangium sp. TaxID=1925024 RepID=UPI002648DBEA|nr:nitroreductase family deazaflavin-dependent oxidoreductase [Intrasporangium sp.]MDN5796229.1 nitroreductase family deazaflavin-dependent oxidoreductase [Intrasporangium sp.]